MNPGRVLNASPRGNNRWRFFITLCLTVSLSSLLSAQPEATPPKVSLTASPEPIYAQDRTDAWNRIFYFLFSRRLEVRLSNEFPEGAPFSDEAFYGRGPDQQLHLSTRTFERNEIGDRAIDPLYPLFSDGRHDRIVLTDPNYSEFTKALREALSETSPRPAMARALMQNDLWAAHDILFNPLLPADEKELGERRRALVELLARLIRKIALTPEEIRSLPDNYSAARQQNSLPDLFRKDSGWIEVRYFPTRTHDYVSGFRRVSRVFLKPAHPPRDMQKFLDALPNESDNAVADLDGVALLMRLLLIDSRGRLEPTMLTTEVQMRLFEKTSAGAFKRTTLPVYEVSRRLLLQKPESGGLVLEDENGPAYAGNYDFASPLLHTGNGQLHQGPPVQVKLRTRCGGCHGSDNLTQLGTFSMVRPPHPPRARQLNPAATEQADLDIDEKTKRKEFEALRQYF